MRLWAAKHAVRVLVVVIGALIVSLELSRALLRLAVRWL